MHNARYTSTLLERSMRVFTVIYTKFESQVCTADTSSLFLLILYLIAIVLGVFFFFFIYTLVHLMVLYSRSRDKQDIFFVTEGDFVTYTKPSPLHNAEYSGCIGTYRAIVTC